MDFVRSFFWSGKKWGKKCSNGQRFICTEVTSYKIHILVEMSYKRPTFENIFLKLDHPNSNTVMDLWNSDTQALLNHNLFSISRLWRCEQSVLGWSAPEKSQGGAILSACAVHTDTFSKILSGSGNFHYHGQSCSVSKETFDLTVTRGILWFNKV